MVGPNSSVSAVWLKTTSRITSSPASCRAATIARNSSRRIGVGIARRRARRRRRVVAPVIGEAVLDQPPLVEKRHDRQELDGGHPEPREVLEHGWMGETQIGAAARLGQVWMQLRHAFDVKLVEHRPVPGALVARRYRGGRRQHDPLGHEGGRCRAGRRQRGRCDRPDAGRPRRSGPGEPGHRGRAGAGSG